MKKEERVRVLLAASHCLAAASQLAMFEDLHMLEESDALIVQARGLVAMAVDLKA